MEGKQELEEIKNSLSLEQIEDLINELGGEPQRFNNNTLVCKTICHNCGGEGSHKLYYYANTRLLRCYTGCADNTFDIFALVERVNKNNGNDKWELPQSVRYIKNYFGIETKKQEGFETQLEDWKILNKYNQEEKEKKKIEMKFYDENTLKYFPFPIIEPWEREGITRETMKSRGICYDPSAQGIVIPHYNDENKLIGIRERTLIKEEEKNGKYKPAYISGKMYNHPLGFTLYNLNNSKENIKNIQKAIIFERRKKLFAIC